MHNYRPPNKYGMRTRMGNWSEEWDLEETKYTPQYPGARSTSARRTTESLRYPTRRGSS